MVFDHIITIPKDHLYNRLVLVKIFDTHQTFRIAPNNIPQTVIRNYFMANVPAVGINMNLYLATHLTQRFAEILRNQYHSMTFFEMPNVYFQFLKVQVIFQGYYSQHPSLSFEVE
jgi:hypothetical protein